MADERSRGDAEGLEPTPALVRNAVVANVLTMDRYVTGLLAVLNGTDPADAIEDCEEQSAEES